MDFQPPSRADKIVIWKTEMGKENALIVFALRITALRCANPQTFYTRELSLAYKCRYECIDIPPQPNSLLRCLRR
jgi:hypothetical protein